MSIGSGIAIAGIWGAVAAICFSPAAPIALFGVAGATLGTMFIAGA